MNTLLEITLSAALREQAATRGGKEFLVFPNRGIRFTFGDVDKKADALAKGLLAAGFKKGDHIGIWANNVPEWTTVFFAAARIGVVVVPINSSYKRNEVEYVISQADLKGLFIIDRHRDLDYTEMVYQLIPELKNAEPGDLISNKFPCLKMIANIDDTSHAGMYTLKNLLEMGKQIAGGDLNKAESLVHHTDILCIMYTSGTTGNPKGAMLTHRSIINNACHANTMAHVNEDAVVLNPLPLFHIMSLTDGIIEILLFGAKAIVMENFDPLICLTAIQKENCTMIYAVPTMYIAMLNHPLFNTFSTTQLKYGYMGGALCPPELAKNLIEKMHLEWLSIGYGLTETSPLICNSFVNDPSDQKLKTIGIPIPGIAVSIRDAENAECPVNTRGEICVKGYSVMQGYYKMEEATGDAIDTNGWFHTGDLGSLLPDGYLVIEGRIKELIIRGGENVYPKEVENLLHTMPGIKDVQAVGIPSKKYGEEIGAFIILKEGASISEKDIVDFCRDKISFFKIPKYVFFVDSFPITPSGKVQKFKLSELGLKEVQAKSLAT
ncbi:MAG: AMP-binding protein [Treponema sp.]|jgi:fatty-acyl-CoA synthase|nr:AMP-binding protein [Treponema sp.]